MIAMRLSSRRSRLLALAVTFLSTAAAIAAPPSAAADSPRSASDPAVLAEVDAWAAQQGRLAQALWATPELGYLETQSSARLQQALRGAGFSVQAGVAGMPTAFVARAGHRGHGPVIAILAEMDALPGMAQAAVPERSAIAGQEAGQACGHNLFGAASVGAARAIAAWLKATGTEGEIRLYGTPAEEGGSGKVYMAKAGLFDDVDVVLHWHPADGNSASQDRSLANISGKFRFRGRAAHAAMAPDRGRSALDGVEALDYMANMMREHVPDGTRIHYIIDDGGQAPNVVPEHAEAYYYVRQADPVVVRDVFARLRKAAEGAALGTGTTVEFEQTGGVFSLLPNDTLGRVVDDALRQVGGVRYDAAERDFATRLQATLERHPALERAQQVQPYGVDGQGWASTDVGDVSWNVPTAGFSVATWVPGTPAHSWQAVATSGMSIGEKGALNAARVLALAATALYRSPQTVEQAKHEFRERRGADFKYEPLLQRTQPPLDYRLKPTR